MTDHTLTTTTTDEPVELPSRYAKAIVAIITAVLVVFGAAVSDGIVTPSELIAMLIAFVTALVVYAVPNLPAGPRQYAKLFFAFVGAALAALATILTGALGFADITLADWIVVALAALGAIGVGIVPNTPAVPVVQVSADVVDSETVG